MRLLSILTSILLSFACAHSNGVEAQHELRQSLAKLKWNNKQVKIGDNLTNILKKNNFSKSQITQVLRFPDLPRPFEIIEKNLYATYSKNKLTYVKIYDLNKDIAYIFKKDSKNQVKMHVLNKVFKTKIKTVSGVINSSLFGSLGNKVRGHKLLHRFRDAFIYDYNLRKSLQKGAKYSLSYEQKYDNGRFIRNGELVSAELEINDRLVKRQFIKDPKNNGGSFIGSNLQEHKKYYSPINYQQISSLFQPRRYHPIRKRKVAHTGVDFVLPEGEPVFAVAQAVVIKVAKQRAMGKFVVLEHEDGARTYYSHLSEFAKNLIRGDVVTAGQKLGTIGCTGYCTKPHLHFAVKKNNRFVNPLRYLKTYSKSLESVLSRKIAALKKD